MIEKLSLRQKCTRDMAKRVLLFKRTIREWFFHAGLKYLKTHTLSDSQEALISEFTDFIVKYMDEINSDTFLDNGKSELIGLLNTKR